MRHKWINVVLVLAVAVFLFSGIQLGRIYLEYRQGTKEYEQLVEEADMSELPPVVPEDILEQLENKGTLEASDSGQEETGEESEPTLSYDIGHDKLKEINSDYIGWLALNEEISYPVVQGSDNSYYLTHTFYGTRNKAGAIFMDADITDGWEAKNVIVYGHNLKNNKMFANLTRYGDQAYAEQHRYFSVYTQDGVAVYGIFAAYETGAVSEAYQYGFASDEEFLEYISKVRSWSVIDTGISVGASDQIITLSTCTNVNDGRFIVQAKKIQ